MLRLVTACIFFVTSQTVAVAQTAAPIDALIQALGVPDLVEIMREEGVAYGEDLQQDLFGGRGGAQWRLIVQEIYNLPRMQDTVRNRLDAELAAEDLAPMIDYFTSDIGRKIVSLEVSARRALLDEAVEQASQLSLSAMIADDDPRLNLLKAFSDAGNLVDNNVVGAMNSNYAFYTGLAEGGAFPGDTSVDGILADIWSQEEAIRLETEDWLLTYLALAYQPLSDAELSEYTEFFETPQGAKLNQALFNAFDEMFVAISLALGQRAAMVLSGQDL